MNLPAVIALSATLGLSLAINVYLIHKLRHKPKRPDSVELKEFLGDLFRDGGAMIAIKRIDTDGIVMRSPRNSA